MSDLILSDFDRKVLYEPAKKSAVSPNNTLKIITAFTDCERISTHVIKLSEGIQKKQYTENIYIDIILGMTKSSLSPKKHEDICRLLEELNGARNRVKVNCSYITNGQEVHSKIYLWGNSHNKGLEILPQVAFCGSLNYTINAFYKRRESVCECDPQSALKYFNDLKRDCLDCFDKNIIKQIKNVCNSKNNEEGPDDSSLEYERYDQLQSLDRIEVSIIGSNGYIGLGSGLNWGIRPNGTKRDPNQAYIPYNKKDKKIGFFPDRINPDDKNCPMFRVLTKDYGSFHMRMAQQGNKALESVESNSILGKWIRKQLGVQPGAPITEQMLKGRTTVTFRKYEDGVYLLDF